MIIRINDLNKALLVINHDIMIIVISPAKTLDFETAAVTTQHTQPIFLDESERIIKKLKSLSKKKIKELMKRSDSSKKMGCVC